MLKFAFSDTCIQCPQTCSNAPSRAETSHLKHLFLHLFTPPTKPLFCWCRLCWSWFFKTCTAFPKLNFLSFTFCGDRAYRACWHRGAQHRNPGTRAVALAPHAHNSKPLFLLHRPAHMPINPRSASLNQVYLQEGSMLAQKPFTCATTQHRKTSCIQQKWNLTREGQSNITEQQTKGSQTMYSDHLQDRS